MGGLDIAGPIIDHATYPPATAEDLAETIRLVEGAGGKILARQGGIRATSPSSNSSSRMPSNSSVGSTT